MGRGDGRSAIRVPAGVRRRAGDLELKEYEAPLDIGTEAHRQRLLSYARQRTGRRDIRIALSHFCGRCRHDYEDHYGGDGYCTHDGCRCDSYLPGGGSFTDMQGNITIQTDVPPGGSLEDRELCIAGLLRHELCHEEYTDRDTYLHFVKELRRMAHAGKEVGVSQIKLLHNILEDGMIETREREEKPASYQYIRALDVLYPRVGEVRPTTQEVRYPAPDGYVPTDADGNELWVETDARGRRWVVVPKGTRLGPWGKRPVHPEHQILAAIHAAAVPGYEVGELHPDIEKVFKECRPHIEAAVNGNTSDCILRAQAIHRILRKHGLMREELSEEEREAMRSLAGAMGQMAASAPDADPDEEPQGRPQQAQNGMPGQMSGEGLSDDFNSALAPSGGGSGDDGAQGGGEEGASKPPAEGGSSARDRKGRENNEKQGEGAEPGDGQGKGEGGSDGAQGAGAGGDFTDGFDPNREVPKESESDASRGEGKGKDGEGGDGPGRLSDEELEEMRKEARKELERDRETEKAKQQARRRAGRFEADDWDLPENETVVSQDRLAATSAEPLPGEQGELAALGRRLGSRLERIKTEARGPQRYKRRGKLDTRRLSAAMAGNPNVFYKPGMRLDLDMEIDVSIDRSGSVTGDRFANENQYRMAKMLAIAARETKVPMAIYGWDGYGGASHYAYKEKHSDDLRGIEALLQTGGGSTPTAEGVRFSRARLGRSKAKHRVMVVITDGAADDPEAAAEQVKAAEAQGIHVLGISFVPKGQAGQSAQWMDMVFRPGSWVEIHDYLEAPRIVGKLIEDAARNIKAGLGALAA